MQIVVNGHAREVPEALSLTALLAGEQLGGKRVAVEINGEIVPRSRHAGRDLKVGDQIEIVQAIGGG